MQAFLNEADKEGRRIRIFKTISTTTAESLVPVAVVMVFSGILASPEGIIYLGGSNLLVDLESGLLG